MKAEFYYSQRKYECTIVSLSLEQSDTKELRIRNHEGEILAVQQGRRTALRGKTRATSQEVDVSRSNYYDLIKAAVNALELAEKNKLIKDKDEQIRLLNAEIDIFKKKANLSDSERDEIVQLRAQIKTLSDQQAISPFDYDEQKAKSLLIKKLGDVAWERIKDISKSDLLSSYKQKYLVESDVFTSSFLDYKPSCLYLASVIEREIVQTFFENFYHFLCQNNPKQRDFFVAGVTISNRERYTIGKLPYFIASEWETFNEDILNKEYLSDSDRRRLYYRKFVDQGISSSDQKLVIQFLGQWDHPVANWLSIGENAASKIDQIAKLRNLTAHPMPIYKWQFTEFWLLVIGGKTKSGRSQKSLLKEVYELIN